MAFTSIGYDGSVNERQWAELVPSVGSSTYGVKGAGDLKVSAVPGQPLMVSVAAGTAWGHGVIDTEASNTTITCDTISSGVRWDLITVRRDWQPLAGGPTSIAKVTGTAEKVIPASRKIVPGVWDDQPLALVQWTFGQTQPTAIIDLRCWAGNGGLVAKDELALTYLAKLGASVKIGNNTWNYEPLGNDLPGWTVSAPVKVDAGQANASPVIKADTVTFPVTNANGDSILTFPTAFPTAIKSVVVMDAQSTGGFGGINIKLINELTDRTRICVRFLNPSGAALPSLTLKASYIAVGY